MKASVTRDTFRVKGRVVVLIPSVACTVKVKEPTAVGLPDSIPFVLSVMPGGNVPEASDQVMGPDLFCSSNI